MSVQFVEGDTGTVLTVTCVSAEDDTVIPLGSITPSIVWKDSTGTAQTRTMTVTDATNGECQYQFAADELEWPEITFEVQLLDNTGSVVTSLDELTFPVKPRI